MAYFGKFYLDKEKDICVELDMTYNRLTYTIRTPNHTTGNLLKNLSNLINVPLTFEYTGLWIIEDKIPLYVNGENEEVYVMRLNGIKVANIFPNGRIERKAYIPAIAKTLMSQTKDYQLPLSKTLVKTYIRSELKFHTDLHSHRSANLSPDILIAFGIHHQLSYPYYYVKKLGLKLTDAQVRVIEKKRMKVAMRFENSELTGKYLDRKIDDNTEINFADLILNNIENSSYNISRIRTSLAIMKDGQAVFTNLEKVYLYRYVFTKGKKSRYKVELNNIEKIEDKDIVDILRKMDSDRKNPLYENNTLYQDKLLWTARSYKKVGVSYAEISDTALLKKSEAAKTLQEIHDIMPKIIKETGVTIRFLAAFRRIPLTIVKDNVDRSNYFQENLQVLNSIVYDPYVAGIDFVGEELNDIRELKSVITEIVKIAKADPGFIIRIHAGENDSLPDNCLNSILCVEKALSKNQKFPNMRIGHGLYTSRLTSRKGQQLIKKINKHEVVLEFQITSNVRLNNLSEMKNHPLKQYIDSRVLCVQGTDGGAIYGTDVIDEQLSLETMLNLDYYDMLWMRDVEDALVRLYSEAFEKKKEIFREMCSEEAVEKYINNRIKMYKDYFLTTEPGIRKYDSATFLSEYIQDLPMNKVPIVIAGGSFNNTSHVTKLGKKECDMLKDLIQKVSPTIAFFVIGPSIKGYEEFLLENAKDRFDVYAYVPSAMTEQELDNIKSSGAKIRVSIEASPLGVYKSIAYEIFKHRANVFISLDGNSAADNLIQEAKNSKYVSYRFINNRAKGLRSKAQFLQGYVTMWNGENADGIVEKVREFYRKYS